MSQGTTLYQQLEELLDLINNYQKAIENELYNTDSTLVYENVLVIDKVSFKGKNYSEIDEIIKYIIDGSSFDVGLKLKSFLEKIKKDFIDKMMYQVAKNRFYDSYTLSRSYLDIINKINYLKSYFGYNFSNDMICMDDLENLKSNVTISLLNISQTIQKFEQNKSNLYRRKKASSDYVRRNKK